MSESIFKVQPTSDMV